MTPRPKKAVRTSVILPEEARSRVDALATANHVSAAWVMRHAILKFLDEHEGQRELPLRLPAARRGQAS
jgi:predicted transcriptional regulator